jgi:hypothetical protein
MNLNWKDVAHYGTAVLAISIGGVTEMGVQLPGVVVSDPKMTITMGIGILVAGLKGGWTAK